MKKIRFGKLLSVFCLSIITFLFTGCVWINEPEPELSDGVIISVNIDNPYVSGQGNMKFNTLSARVNIDNEAKYTTFPYHLKEEIVEGTEVKCRTHCGDVWKYKNRNGKWKDVTWGASEIKE